MLNNDVYDELNYCSANKEKTRSGVETGLYTVTAKCHSAI